MPLVFAQRLLGHRGAARARGVELTERLLERAARQGVPVAFYGGTSRTQALLLEAARRRYPGLRVAAAISPPFRAPTPEEDEADVRAIVASGARILLVGIGCPKQERWMADHASRLPCVMVGVGQAFDLLAGVVNEAPRWMHGLGLSWLHRLAQEPRRLFWRYARHNPRFLGLLLAQVLRHHLGSRRPAARLAGM
jgi:N-acetylglucosaminyldiphosphoundecaprenol N-acetyl-beta-D-mannosaminyltransferase